MSAVCYNSTNSSFLSQKSFADNESTPSANTSSSPHTCGRSDGEGVKSEEEEAKQRGDAQMAISDNKGIKVSLFNSAMEKLEFLRRRNHFGLYTRSRSSSLFAVHIL